MIQINSKSSSPIFEQIQKGIKELIYKGALKEGDKLPSVRELAVIITTNPNTISKAYKYLEQENLIITSVGKGTYINHGAKELVTEGYINGIKEDVARLIHKAIKLNLKLEEIIEMENEVYFKVNGGTKC